MIWNKARKLIVGMACGAMPLAFTATCDPYYGSLTVVRGDDCYDCGGSDFILDGWFWDTWYGDDCCSWGDCYCDDYYYDEIVIWE